MAVVVGAMNLPADTDGAAQFSPDRRFRFRLDRWLRGNRDPRYVLWVGATPRNATAHRDDPVTRLCWRATVLTFGMSAMVVVNLSPQISREPELVRPLAAPAEHIQNEMLIAALLPEAHGVCFAHGDPPMELLGIQQRVLLAAMRAKRKLWCLGSTKQGWPVSATRHVVSATEVQAWAPRILHPGMLSHDLRARDQLH